MLYKRPRVGSLISQAMGDQPIRPRLARSRIPEATGYHIHGSASEREICGCHRELCQWLNGYKTCQLSDMDLAGSERSGHLRSEGATWQDMDSPCLPGLLWES